MTLEEEKKIVDVNDVKYRVDGFDDYGLPIFMDEDGRVVFATGDDETDVRYYTILVECNNDEWTDTYWERKDDLSDDNQEELEEYCKTYEFQNDKFEWDSMTKEEYCKSLIQWYSHEQSSQKFKKLDYKEMFSKYNRDDFMKFCGEDAKKLYDSLPSKVTVYRGADKDELTNGVGISWTIKELVAYWFAYGQHRVKDSDIEDGRRCVLTCTVDKEDIRAIITSMDEYEVILITDKKPKICNYEKNTGRI